MRAIFKKQFEKLLSSSDKEAPYECCLVESGKAWRVRAGNWVFEAATLEEAQKKALEIFPKAQFSLKPSK